MKKIFAAVLLGAALSLTACGGSDEPAPRETLIVEGTPSPRAQSGMTTEEIFVQIIRDNVPSSSALSDSELVEFGNNICLALDQGNTLEEIGMVGVENGMRPRDIGFVMGASVAAFCPEYEDDVHNMGSSSV